MATYDSIIARTETVIPEQMEAEIFQAVPEASAVMRRARRLRDMSRQEEKLRVVDALATAYFVGSTTAASGDSARIQTSEVNWTSVSILAAKLGVIVPIPADVLQDLDYDAWAEIRPQIAEALGKAFDAAVLYGTNAPSDWPDDLLTGATAASTVVSLATKLDFYDAMMGETGVISLVEGKGFMVNGHVAHVSTRSKMRGCRDSNGAPIFLSDPTSPTRYTLDGEPVDFPRNGAVSSASSLVVSGDWSQLVYSMRKGVTFQMLTEASIFDGSGTLQYSLAQDDMVALKATMRIGWQLPNPPNRIDGSATQYPFGILTA